MIQVKRALALLALCYLAGCDEPRDREEAAACKAFFKRATGVEASFAGNNVRVVDSPISISELKRNYYQGSISETERLHLALFDGKPLGIRNIAIVDEKNEAVDGVKLNTFACDFMLVDGNLYQAGSLVALAEQAALNQELAQTASILNDSELNAIVPRQRNNSPCCVP